MKKILLIAFSVFALAACQPQSSATTQTTQPVYDQIMKTGTIHCGYAAWAPLFILDPNSKKPSGVFYDVMQEIGRRLDLKIEWTEETGWATVTESIKTRRFDMACSAFWISSTRAKHVDFTTPLVYSTANIWVSSKNTKTFHSFADFNNKQTTFGLLDGSAEGKTIALYFPKAKTFSFPETVSGAEVLQGLAAGKFDAVAYDDGTVADFTRSNPGLIKKVPLEKPLTIFPNAMLLPAGETKLKAMLDNTINEINYDGTLAKIIEKYHATETIKLPAKPYQDQ